MPAATLLTILLCFFEKPSCFDKCQSNFLPFVIGKGIPVNATLHGDILKTSAETTS